MSRRTAALRRRLADQTNPRRGSAGHVRMSDDTRRAELLDRYRDRLGQRTLTTKETTVPSNPFTRRRQLDAADAAPRPANGPAPAATIHRGPALHSKYWPNIATTGTERLMPRTRRAEFPAAEDMRALGAAALADAIEAHHAAARAYFSARTAVDAAEPPAGGAWRAAVAADGAALAAGREVDPADSATARVLAARPALLAAAVLAAHRNELTFDRVLTEAAAADTARQAAEAELDAWVRDAADKVRRGVADSNRALLAEVEHEQQQRYPALRARWQWLAHRGAAPFKPVRSGVDRRLADAIVENADRLSELMGRYGLFGPTSTGQLTPSGNY